MWNEHHIFHPSRWSAREMILAAMLGTLAAVAVTAVIAMSLAPPSIYFSIRGASLQINKAGSDGAGSYSFYNFTLVANNTGRRMDAHYGALQTEIWINATVWLPAEVDPGDLLGPPSSRRPQPPANSTAVRGWAEYFEYDQSTKPGVTAGEAETWPRCTVVVTARVRFGYGRLAFTRPYSIRVVCRGVDFVNETPYANCTA